MTLGMLEPTSPLSIFAKRVHMGHASRSEGVVYLRELARRIEAQAAVNDAKGTDFIVTVRETRDSGMTAEGGIFCSKRTDGPWTEMC